MVLILLSSPNHLNPLWPSTPRAMDVSPLSPRTPLTPSPSFFAILSPIFTSDDSTPTSPAGLLQVSPGMIPPETPPPWLLGPRSPATSVRPTLSRANSYFDTPTPTLSRALTGERLIQLPRQLKRPAFPSTTYSFTAGHAQAFRPPPPIALQRVKTEPITRGSFTPSQALDGTTKPLPELSIRPPSSEQLKAMHNAGEDHLQDSEAEILTIAMVEDDSEPSTPLDCESMDISIGFEAPPSTPRSGYWPISTLNQWPTVSKAIPRSVSEFQHSRSPSSSTIPSSDNITVSLKVNAHHLSKQTYKPLELTSVNPHRMMMSVANLKQFDEEMGCSHIQSRYELR